eukprot:CAMPEP_0174314282 /NCGR_PEP_ID=MMETSP0810-20121108/5542_1 /TAXON_ID=73025 ORGANISM="Eutreptiella gymnastica-like, Strain CCMP1594" /NCGR_SAMPLE_ID=MMETSP0810 /ASSEMBLY_ACC=CAM_ASM_000659 /LENGTH=58 /DNA_ID=CAMNT_0015423335 /DNA_START=351 /DNA_END=527 /DNA_ORIENTATION=+
MNKCQMALSTAAQNDGQASTNTDICKGFRGGLSEGQRWTGVGSQATTYPGHMACTLVR